MIITFRANRLFAIAIYLLASPNGLSAAPDESAIDSVEKLWSGFDPRKLPLEIEVVKTWDEGDVHLESFYFTGEEFDGVKTRIFAYYGRPKKVEGKIPAVLHVHGGGQTAVLDWPRFWAKRGYACLSFDFCGDLGVSKTSKKPIREHFTRWGKVPADMAKIGGGISMKPTPKHNPWFHWMLAARRGLTFLESRPEVDAEKLGVFGISVGGTLTWGIAAVDSRVKAAAPIYGCGWEFYPYPPDPKAPVDDDLRLWRTLIAPEAMAPRIQCPLLLLSATNDGHGRMDLAFRTLDRLKTRSKWQVFTPNYDHHVEPGEAASLPKFFDVHLKGNGKAWPETPKLEFVGGAKVPRVRVSAENAERVVVYYCINNDWPTTRFWRTAEAKSDGDGRFIADTPFVSGGDTLFAFANVDLKDGPRLSTRLEQKSVGKLAGAMPTLQRSLMIDTMASSADWAWIPAFTDPCRDDRFFEPWTGRDVAAGFTLDSKTFGRAGEMHYYFGTRKIGDPQYRGTARKILAIDHLSSSVPDKLTVRLWNRIPGSPHQEFTAELPKSTGEGDWRTWRMEPSQFRDVSGNPLKNWNNVEHFILNGINPPRQPPVFRNLRWE